MFYYNLEIMTEKFIDSMTIIQDVRYSFSLCKLRACLIIDNKPTWEGVVD